MGPIGKFLIIFFSAIIVLALIGLVMKLRDAKKNPSAPKDGEEALSEKTVENVHDLRDRFNRARYMDKDGE